MTEWTERVCPTGSNPNFHELRCAGMLITVHRLTTKPGKWFISCSELRLIERELHSTDLHLAQCEALERIRNFLSSKVTAIDTAITIMKVGS